MRTFPPLFLALAVATPAFGQTTPTERAAAADILEQIDALQASPRRQDHGRRIVRRPARR